MEQKRKRQVVYDKVVPNEQPPTSPTPKAGILKSGPLRKKRRISVILVIYFLRFAGPLEYKVSGEEGFCKRVATILNDQCKIVSSKRPALSEACTNSPFSLPISVQSFVSQYMQQYANFKISSPDINRRLVRSYAESYDR